jgi:hypothetical protein
MTPTTAGTHSISPELAGTRRFATDEYHRLSDAGILGPEDKVELLGGHILCKAGYPELLPKNTAFPEWRRLRPFASAEYRTRTDYKPGDAVPVTLDGRTAGTIPASELLP